MVIMALDHVRDFFHADSQVFSPENLARTTPILFFTRWITHFCAPVFFFLAGVAIHFVSTRRTSKSDLSRFLVTRGLWLILLDWTVMNVGFSFNFESRAIPLTVFWSIGWAMIGLAGLVWLPRRVALITALAILTLHNALDKLQPKALGSFGGLWSILHTPTVIPFHGHLVMFLYPLLPWFGVVAAGYCFGPIMQLEETKRRKTLLRLGLSLTAAFVLLRFLNVYGDPSPWSHQTRTVMTVVSFLRVSKYPPSLDFLLMTLGPAIFLLAFLDRVRPRTDNFLRVLGRVPLFYFVVHFYLIHALGVLFGGLRYNNWTFFLQFPGKSAGLPTPGFPDDYGYSLAVTYLIWAAVVALMYFPCRWYMHYKARKQYWWLSYL